MQRLSYLLVPGVIAVVLFAGISEFGSSISAPESAPRAELDFNAVSEGISSTLYDSSGAIQYTLEAERQTHFNDDSTVLTRPTIQLFQEGESEWQLQADSGRIYGNQVASPGGTQTIDLIGNVEIVSADEYGNDIELQTQFSHRQSRDGVDRDRPSRHTKKPANLSQSSVGMSGDLSSDEFLFHRETQGSYEPVRD